LYAQTVSHFVKDPWALRNHYIWTILGLQPAEDLVAEMAGRRLAEEESLQVQLLLKAQYERQKMYASCGWYFEDFDRIEPRNCVAYAAQAGLLARRATGVDLMPALATDLRRVVSARVGLRGDQVLTFLLQRVSGQVR
jgi:hypothetical protein